VTLDEFKSNIREEIQATSHNMLQYVMDNFTKLLQECITVEGVYNAFCFQKVNRMCIKLNFQDFCYMLMCQFILFTE
jgi:hypothetical protein